MAEQESVDDAGTYPLNEPTYVRIKRAIIRDLFANVFAIGAPVTIEMLTSRYHVSHMPVREALRQLEGEGVVVSSAHKGFRFEAVTEGYIRNIYDIRVGIESMLARRAVEKANAADLADLERLHQKLVADMDAPDRRLASLTNIEWHRRLYRIAGNPEADQILEGRTLVVRTFGHLSLGGYRDADRPIVVAEHEAIMAAIRNGDAEGCGRAVFDHVTAARDRLLERMIEAKFIQG